MKSVSTPEPSFGGTLTDADYASLNNSWITPGLADQALLRRVTSLDGSHIVGRRDNGSYSGIIFPYVWPGESHVRDYWLRRDHPEIEFDGEGQPKEKAKYLAPPGRSNLLYFVPGTSPHLLDDIDVPIAITEGAKKTIALYRLSSHGILFDKPPRFLPVGLAGVWSFRGIIGKTEGPDGSRRPVKGSIPDLDRIAWRRRRVFVVYDANVHTNPSVAAARRALTQELTKRGAEVRWVNLPTQESRN